MATVAGHGAQKLDLVVPAPGLLTPQYAQQHGPSHTVVHKSEGGGAHHDGLLGGDAHVVGEELARLRDAQQLAVVAAVQTAGVVAVALRVEDVQQGEGQLQLVSSGLAPGHIQLEPLGLKPRVGLG